MAFTPMFTAISAAINNDALANLLAACAVWLLMALPRRGATAREALLAGALAGLLLLAKLTVYLFVPLLLLALLAGSVIEARPTRRSPQPTPAGGAPALPTPGARGRSLRPGSEPGHLPLAARNLALALGVALVLSGWWFARNAAVYGLADLLATGRHDQVVVGQLRWSETGLAPLEAWWLFGSTLFRSYWAQFGWMGIVVSDRLYWLYLVFAVLGGAGLALARRERAWRGERSGRAILVLGISVLAVVGEVLYYNLTFVQPQGRYLFPALAPLSLLLALGWDALARRGGWLAGLVAGCAVFALGVAGEELFGVLLRPAGLVPPALLALLAALAGPRLGARVGALALMVLALAALDLACLVGFVQRFFAG